jgi:hypothetical protein
MSNHMARVLTTSATDFIKELMKETYTENEDCGKKYVYKLSNAKITGDISLRYLVVKKAIEICDCDFEGEVDLRNCEFLHGVNFSNCTFHKKFNTGDKTNSNTIYKELICERAIFEAGASFMGIRCAGSAVFRAAQFTNQAEEINFESASFGKYLVCDNTVFKGGANFQKLSCGSGGSFCNSKFVSVTHTIDFTGADWGKSLECEETIFNGGAIFNSIKCGLAGHFRNAQFNHQEKVIDFRFAFFETALVCTNAIFKGGATFNGSKYNSHADFTNAKFENKKQEIDFSFSYYRLALQCVGTIFEGGAIFNTIKCDGKADFERVHFRNKDRTIDFKFSYFAGNLRFPMAVLSANISLDYSQIGASFNLKNTLINNKLSLNHVSIKRLSLDEVCPFRRESLDLRECVFGSFEADKKHWKQFVAAQMEGVFSRDPYLQLEKYYQSIGNDVEAKEVYFEGRCAIRKYEKGNNTINWSRRRRAGDFLLKLLTGYGVKTHRLLYPILFFIFLGVLIFWDNDAIKAKEDNANRIKAATLEMRSDQGTNSEQGTSAPQSANLKSPQNDWDKIFNRIFYSVDLFVPVIKLDLTDKWVPASPGREKYAVIHRIAGWFLIPLLVASWSGIVRRQ